MNRDTRATEIQRDIGNVLRRYWDPIAVAGEPGCADEYSSYVGAVYRLLVSGASTHEVAQHLAAVEAKAMGIQGTDPRSLLPVAERLIGLDVRLDLGETAT